jgi:hypothetical protein
MASTGNARHTFPLNERGLDNNFYGSGVKNIWLPRSWHTTIQNNIEQVDLSPTINTTNYSGGFLAWNIDSRGDLFGGTGQDMCLVINRGPLSVTGGTYARFVDFEGFFMIDRFTMLYGNRKFYDVTGEELYEHFITHCNREKRSSVAPFVKGYLNVTQRNASAASAQDLVIPLFSPYSDPRMAINKFALPNEIRIEIRFKELRHTTQTDGTSPTCTLTSASLRTYWVHLKEVDRRVLFNMTRTPKGYSKKTYSRDRIPQELLPSGRTFYRIKLSNFVNASYFIFGKLRTTYQVDNTDSTRDLINHVTPTRYWIIDGSNRVTDQFGDDYTRGIGWNDIFPDAEPGLPYICIPLCPPKLVLASERDCYGSRLMNSYSNAELYLEFDSPLTVYHYLDVVSFVHNIDTEILGDYRKFLQL